MSPLLLLLAVALFVQAPAVGVRPVDAVRALYASAAYDEAIAYVAKMETSAVTVDVEQVRALCFFALGRTDEAQQAFDRMVRLAPRYQIAQNDVAPRVYELFRDTRRRTLPLVVRDRYAGGKQSFDEKRFPAAAADLREVLALLDDPDLAETRESFVDLKQLAEGFVRLADLEQEIAARASAAAAAPPAPAAAPPVAAAPAAPVVTRIVVYSADDKDVLPPVEVERYMPPWNPPTVMQRMAEYRGSIEVVIDEMGRVEVATILRPTIASYDLSLVGATRRWRFQPAMRNGEPVKFRRTYDIVITPSR